MADYTQHIRLKEFYARPLHWMVVHHLLPADLLRELASAIIEVSTEGKLQFNDLFEDIAPTGPMATSNWYIAARETGSPFTDFLSRLIITMVWKSDETPSLPHDGVDNREAVWIQDLRGAFALSSTNLDATLDCERQEDEGALGDVFTALAAARGAIDGSEEENLTEATDVDRPSVLKALLIKHIGDLYADLDRWQEALVSYRTAEKHLYCESGWDDTVATTQYIVAQSIAMATWHVHGPNAAVPLLETLANKRGIVATPLPTLNARFDFLNASYACSSSSIAGSNKHVAAYLAPLIINSHKLDNAMTSTSVGRYQEAHRWFSATLRRQTALGGAAVSWATRGYYGRSIIDELQTLLGSQNIPDKFVLAVRMLVESGRAELIEKTNWSADLVETYVNDNVLNEIMIMVKRNSGVAIERSLVVTALHREWLLVLPRDREALARRMLSDLVEAVRTGAYTGMARTNTGGIALKSLKTIGKARPEFRRLVGPELIRILDDMLANRGALTVSEALETVEEFIGGLDDETVKALCDLTIKLVERLPSGAAWPVIRAAQKLLESNAAALLASKDDRFKRDRSIALIKLALNSAQENSSLLYVLRDVDLSSISEHIDAQGIAVIVDGIRKGALEISSSAATSNIHALLVAPKVSGQEGVHDALLGMLDILHSAQKERPSPALHNSYEVLLLLARHGDEIASNIENSASFIEDAKGLIEPLCAMWRIAASNPLIFAGFAIPPLSVPDRVIVHNWTFATLEFAKWLNLSNVVETALNVATANESLGESMSVARAIQGTSSAVIDGTKVALERADAFYAALGERLAAMEPLTNAAARAQLRILLDRCMQVGPRGEDAALLLMSKRLNVLLDPQNADVTSYVAKIRNESKLRLSLSPFLHRALVSIS